MKLNIKSIRLNNEFFQAIVRSVIKNKVVKETSWSLLARIIAITLIFTTNIILARFLGPDKFGIYNVFLSMINVVLVIVALGLDFSASRMIAKYSNKLKLIRYVINVVVRCQIISLIIFLTAFYFLIGSISNFYGIE